MGNIIGVRSTIAVALTFKYISYALLLLIPNYYVVLFAMCLFGVGSGLGNLTYLKNSWKYFPSNQGLVNGIILGGAGISSSILTPLADFLIINPEKEKANTETGLYSKEVGNRVPTYLVILCVTFLALGILSLFITFPYEEEKKDKENIRIGEENGDENEDEGPKKIKARDGEKEASLKDTFFSLKNCQLLSFCFCGFCK